MIATSGLPRLVQWLAAAAVVAALLVPTMSVRAADVVLGTPQATATFGQGIEFTVPLNAGVVPRRVELRLRFPDAIGPYISLVPVTQVGSQTLRYELDLSDGGLPPNTPIAATWAVFTSRDAPPVLSRTMTVRYDDTSHAWRSVTGDVVVVHWYEGTEAFARKALVIGDDAVREVGALLGVTESQPIDIFIYADEAGYRAAAGPGTREWSGATPRSAIRTLFALITPGQVDSPWVGMAVPHELTHILFETAVRNPYRSPPFWFDEGMAVYLSQGYEGSDRGLVNDAARTGDLIPFTALSGSFPTDANRSALAYAEAASAVDYIVRTDGREALLALIAAYQDGLTDDEAFTMALGRDLRAFQADWLKELGAGEPERYGPRSAPPGPLPPGWSASSPSQAPGASPGSAPGTGTPSSDPGGAPGSDGGSAGGLGSAAVLAAILAVIAVVAIALLLARRRAAAG